MHVASPQAYDDISDRSSLTSVFHDLLGDGLAKKVAELPALVQRTEHEGKMLISRQRRETRRGEDRKFSISMYRRLAEEEAMSALRTISDLPAGVELRLAAAMYARVPIWHVVVKGVDKPRINMSVSIYFLQNLEELRDLARECLIEFLDQDEPSVIKQAVENAQFRSWCHQWYHQSEDLADERSLRYICRLPGCAVLTHCVRNDFGECTEFLLENFSDITSPQPWLVLAEPMRYFGKFQVNAFHEAAYNGASAALNALIHYGNRHGLPWRESLDKDGKTALEIARSQVEKGRPGAETCFVTLRAQYVTDEEVPPAPREETLAENVLLVTWKADDEQELCRHRQPLPDEASWKDVVDASKVALLNRPRVPGTPAVMIYKSIITDGEMPHVLQFFELWNDACSIGCFKTRMQYPDAPLHVVQVMNELLSRPDAPVWERVYMFGAMFGIELTEDISSKLAIMLRSLSWTLASRPQLPLWRVDRFPASLLLEGHRHISNLLAAAMDVKHCAHQLIDGKTVYRFFWSRLEAVERNMLDRMKLLHDANIASLEDAIDPQAVAYLEGCVHLWVSALCCGDGSPDTLMNLGILDALKYDELLRQIDDGISGAFRMRNTLPEIPAALIRVLRADVLPFLPKTASALGGTPTRVQNRPQLSLVARQSQPVQLRPHGKAAPRLHRGRDMPRVIPCNPQSRDIQPEDSLSNVGVFDARSDQIVTRGGPSNMSQASQQSQTSSSCLSFISVADAGNTTQHRCFLTNALFKTPENHFVQAQDLREGVFVRGASGDNLRVKSIRVHEQQEQTFVDLRSSRARLVVTESHRVMVQRGKSSQTLSAGALKPGESVLCCGRDVETLVEAKHFQAHLEVVEVVFEPDDAVEAFHPVEQDAILSKGHGWPKTTRRSKGASGASEAVDIDCSSIPGTDYGEGW